MKPHITRFRADRRTAALLMLGAAMLMSAGCVRFGGEAPKTLLTITSQAPEPAGASVTATSQTALFVELPTSSKAIATLRVAVRDSETSYAYVKEALWVDLPTRQFQGLLSETVRTRAGRMVLDPTQYLARPSQMLQGSLRDFGVDAMNHRAVVTYDASLMSPDGQSVVRQRFTAAVPIGKIDAATVAPAISQAANQVAAAVADWVKAQPQN